MLKETTIKADLKNGLWCWSLILAVACAIAFDNITSPVVNTVNVAAPVAMITYMEQLQKHISA